MGINSVTRLAVLAVLAASSAARAAESVYTDLPLDNCRTLVAPQPDEPGGDFISLSCPGLGKYRVLFKEGDVRQSIHYGFLTPSIVDGAFESFGSFNHANPKIEWRIDADGTPYAAIQRFFTGDAESRGQVLTVSRVGQPGDEEGCPVGYVDALANKEPNMLAREIADTLAVSFRCGRDSPVYHGRRGPKSGDPMIHHGDRQQ